MQHFQIEVFNSNGEAQSVRFSDVPDISDLPAGEYTICFQLGEDTYTERFVKD